MFKKCKGEDGVLSEKASAEKERWERDREVGMREYHEHSAILRKARKVLYESLDVALNNKSPDGKVTEVYLTDVVRILSGLSDLYVVMGVQSPYDLINNDCGEV